MSAGRRLMRALENSAATAGCSVRMTAARERPWSSATYVGMRHVVTVRGGPSAALAEWLGYLREASLVVPGHVVAEMLVRSQRGGAGLEVLTLEAPPPRR